MTLDEAFGNVLRNLRNGKGFSQEHLASECELHRTYISQLERGLKSPSLAAIQQISRALSVPMHHIILLTEEELIGKSISKDVIHEID